MLKVNKKEAISSKQQKGDDILKLEEKLNDKKEYQKIDIEKIKFIENDRINKDDETLNELADSIKERGLLEPILLNKLDNDEYRIISGHRRYLAIKVHKLLNKIPSIILENIDEKEIPIIRLIENIQREDLSAFEEATAIKNMMTNLNISTSKAGKLIGKSKKYIVDLTSYLESYNTLNKYNIDFTQLSKSHVIEIHRYINIDNLKNFIDELKERSYDISIKEIRNWSENHNIIKDIKQLFPKISFVNKEAISPYYDLYKEFLQTYKLTNQNEYLKLYMNHILPLNANLKSKLLEELTVYHYPYRNLSEQEIDEAHKLIYSKITDKEIKPDIIKEVKQTNKINNNFKIKLQKTGSTINIEHIKDENELLKDIEIIEFKNSGLKFKLIKE